MTPSDGQRRRAGTMIVIIGDATRDGQLYIEWSINWLKRNTSEVDSKALALLERKHTGWGAIKSNPDSEEVLYIVGHGDPMSIGGMDVYAVAQRLLEAGLTGARFGSFVLCACNTGDNRWVRGVGADFAKTLAKLLQVCVRAPPGLVRADIQKSGANSVPSGIQYTIAMPTADQKALYDSLLSQHKLKEAEALCFKFPTYPFFQHLVSFTPDGAGYIPPLKV